MEDLSIDPITSNRTSKKPPYKIKPKQSTSLRDMRMAHDDSLRPSYFVDEKTEVSTRSIPVTKGVFTKPFTKYEASRRKLLSKKIKDILFWLVVEPTRFEKYAYARQIGSFPHNRR